jgi:hypothetical protein
MEYSIVLSIRTDTGQVVQEEELYWFDGLAEAEEVFNDIFTEETEF